jgi:hypothetical protein
MHNEQHAQTSFAAATETALRACEQVINISEAATADAATDVALDSVTCNPQAALGWDSRPGREFAWGDQSAMNPLQLAAAWIRDNGVFRYSLILGAIVAAFGLGWLSGSESNHARKAEALVSPQLTPAPHTSIVSKGDRLDAHVALTTTQVPARPVQQPPDTIAQLIDKYRATGSAHARVAATQGATAEHEPLGALGPVPETKPATIDGWMVRGVSDGRAVLVGPDRVWTVAQGDSVPGLGRIDTFVRWGNHWIVVTARGLISSQ